MSDLNVALRLRLDNQMKAGADGAKRDLQQLKAEAEKLGKTNAALSPASLRAAQQTRQIETQKAVAVERTTAAYRRQRSEMLAGDLAARRLDRARDVRATREVQRARRNAQMGVSLRNFGPVDWGGGAKPALLRSQEAQRRARLNAMTTTMAAQRAAEVRAARAHYQAGRPAGVAVPGSAPTVSPTSVPVVPPSAGPSLATGAGVGVAAQGRSQGLSYARSFVGGLGVGIGVAAVGQFVKESLLGAADDEFERDQLRVLGNLSEAQMETYRKSLDKTARLRGVGSKGSLGIFGGLMAGGLSSDEAVGMTDNVAIFAKATKSSLEDASRATVALRNNMKLIDPKHIMAAYDAIAAGGKAGEFEVQDMARHLPSLLAKMEKLGETGVTGVRNTVAISQAVRKVVGSSDEAATIMENLLDTFTSREFVAGAKKVGIDVEKSMKDAKDKGLSPVFAMLHQIHKKTGGDPFKVAKLIPNKRAADALIAALREAGFMMELLDEMASSAGSTMEDYRVATDNAKEAWGRFSASIIEKSKEVVGQALPSLTSGMDALTSLLNNNEKRAGGLLEKLGGVLSFMNDIAAKTNEGLSGNAPGQKDILTPLLFGKPLDERTKDAYQEYGRTRREALDLPVSANERRRKEQMRALQEDLGPNVVAREDSQRAEIDAYREYGQTRAQSNRDLVVRKKITMPGPARADDGTLMPPPRVNTFDRMLEGMKKFAPDADAAMDEYNDALGRGLDDARTKISAAVNEFRAMLSFSAGPTISPTMLPAGAAVSAPVQQAGGGSGGGSVNVTQNISTSDSRMAARRSQREQNRAMSLAMNNALHDTGAA